MYRGFYINLDRSQTRRAEMTRHLEEIGLAGKYQRFPAIDGRAIAGQYNTKLDPGNLGLWLTHEAILRENLQADEHLHILEDDALLAPDTVAWLERLLSMVDKRETGWDIIFTDVHLVPEFAFFNFLLGTGKRRPGEILLVDLKPVQFASTTSMIINKRSISKYYDLIRGQWAQAAPIDIYIRRLVRKDVLKAEMTFPFLTTVSRHTFQSDIRGEVDRSRNVHILYRRAMFKDADLASLNREMDDLCGDMSSMALAQIFFKSLTFTWSHKYVDY